MLVYAPIASLRPHQLGLSSCSVQTHTHTYAPPVAVRLLPALTHDRNQTSCTLSSHLPLRFHHHARPTATIMPTTTTTSVARCLVLLAAAHSSTAQSLPTISAQGPDINVNTPGGDLKVSYSSVRSVVSVKMFSIAATSRPHVPIRSLLHYCLALDRLDVPSQTQACINHSAHVTPSSHRVSSCVPTVSAFYTCHHSISLADIAPGAHFHWTPSLASRTLSHCLPPCPAPTMLHDLASTSKCHCPLTTTIRADPIKKPPIHI